MVGPTVHGSSLGPDQQHLASRAEAIFRDLYGVILRRVDRFFGILMIFQWLAGIACALLISPRAWSGPVSYVHVHVWAAALLGGCLTLLPASLAFFYPGHVLTRQLIAVSQILYSALLIHLTGGRIETHFHIFGSLAFLAFYRDWRVLLTASMVVAIDHFVRGLYWPRSVYAVADPEAWRWLEHTGWVIFEDLFLTFSCMASLRELKAISVRQASLEFSNLHIENLRLAAEKASIAKSAFLANMSHEMRTPLASIVGFSQLLQMANLPDHTRQVYLDVLARNGAALGKLIDDILDLSKVEAGQMALEVGSFSLLALAQDVVGSLAVASQKKDLRLDIDHTANRCDWIKSDPARVRQVLVNVIGNSVKFTDQGFVKVSIASSPEPAGVHVQILVTDTGPGISQADQAKIFQPFVQGDSSNTRQFGGTGLGLALSRHLMHKLGGDLQLAASAPGLGAVFRLDFVAAPGDAAEPSVSPPPPAGRGDTPVPTCSGMRILVVDDFPDNLLLLRTILESSGAQVECVTSGAEALARASVSNFDLVFLDIQMPVMDGYATARALRCAGFAKAVIALTAHALPEEREKCLQAGCNQQLTKPIDRVKLFDALAYARQDSCEMAQL